MRAAYLPEILLTYVSVLNFTAYYLNRDLLLKSMDLAAIIANDSILSDCILEAGKMSKFVLFFAAASKSMLLAEKPRSKNKDISSKHMTIWTVPDPSVSAH